MYMCVHTCACACVLAHVCPCRTQVCARVCVCARVLHVCACVAHTCAPPHHSSATGRKPYPPLRHTPSGTEHTALVLTALRQQPEGAACRTSSRGGGHGGRGQVFANTREVDRGPGRTPCGWTQVDSRRSTTVRTGMWSREHRHAPLPHAYTRCVQTSARAHTHTHLSQPGARRHAWQVFGGGALPHHPRPRPPRRPAGDSRRAPCSHVGARDTPRSALSPSPRPPGAPAWRSDSEHPGLRVSGHAKRTSATWRPEGGCAPGAPGQTLTHQGSLPRGRGRVTEAGRCWTELSSAGGSGRGRRQTAGDGAA